MASVLKSWQHPVQALWQDGVAAEDIAKLVEAGINNVRAVVFVGKKMLEIIGISDAKAEAILAASMEHIPMVITTALEVHRGRANLVRISTGSKKLDGILNGGVETGAVTELVGEAGAGKTQLCLSLAVTCQLGLGGGARSKCMYIDADGTFRPERIVDTAKRFKLDPRMILDNVTYAKAYTSDHQLTLLLQAKKLMGQMDHSLLIVDSATALYRTDYFGPGEGAARDEHMALFLRTLKYIAEEFGVAVVITNPVGARLRNLNFLVGDNTVSYATTTRLYLRKEMGSSHICRLIASPSLPFTETAFSINAGGIEDMTDY